MLFAVSLLVTFSYAQEKRQGDKPVDSLVKKAGARVKSKLSSAGRELLSVRDSIPLKPYLSDFKRLIDKGKATGSSLLSKIDLFTDGNILTRNNTGLEMGYSYLRDTSGVALGLLNSLNGSFNYDVSTGISLMSMPFDFSFRGNNSLYEAQYTPFDKLVKFNFDPEKYIEEIRSKTLSKLKPETVLAMAMSRIDNIRAGYEKMLREEIQSVKNEFQTKYNTAIEIPDGITDLTRTDLSVLKSKLLVSNNNREYRESVERMQEKVKSGKSLEDSSGSSDLATVKKAEALEKLYNKIVSWKERFENNKLVKELKNNLPFTPQNYKSFLSNPANLEKVVDEHIDLNFIQRLFMNITRLDLGQNPVQDGTFSLENLVNTGVNAGFKNKKASVGFIYGRNHNINSWLQSGLTSVVTNEYSSVTGIKFGTGTASSLDHFVSVNFFDFTNSLLTNGPVAGLQPNYLSNPNRKDGTISFHTGLKLSPRHTITVDVSKSFGSYENNITPDSIGYKINAHNELLTDAGKSNYAAMIDYTGEILNSDISIFFKKVGLGYNNPGNILLRSGETQVGFGFAKRLLQRKLDLRYNIDYRNQQFDPSKRFTHTALNNKIRVGYRLKRNTRVALAYQRSDFKSELFMLGTSNGVNERLQADGSYSFKIDGKRIMNTVSISQQRIEAPVFADQLYKSKSVMVMYSSTALLNKNPMSLLLLLNKSDQEDYLFNTSMFTTEVNYSYSISQKIRLGNSLGYYANTGWNRQVGIKQQFSATLYKKLFVDFDVSYKKAVQVTRPELANQLFISSGIRFDF